MALRDDLSRHLHSHFTAVDIDRLGRYGTHRRGKVRDLFVGDDEILMITTDRLSADDR